MHRSRRPDAPPSPKAGSSRDRPDELLNEYLLLEHKFQPRLCLPEESDGGEVSTGARDGAAHVLRCLKVWYELPADVLIDAINLFDRFLTKMKVRPCHVPCITVSCMNIALDKHARDTGEPRRVSIEELVSVSQWACTAGDVSRMSRVVADKLALAADAPWLTALQWARLLGRLLAPAQPHLMPLESELENLVEIVACDAQCANARPSELALVLIYYKLAEKMAAPEEAYPVLEAGARLQAMCRMSAASLSALDVRVRRVVCASSARAAAPQRQRLVWRLSTRTLKVLRPTDRLTSLLPTIEEQHLNDAPNRNRSGSESSEGEDTCDWPRSPVLPVYCDH